MNTIKRRSILGITITAVVLSMVAVVAFAQRPHFIGEPTFSTNGGVLSVCGSIAGLGNRDVTITLEATAVTTCTNRGNNIPPGQTETVSGTVSNLRPENGRVNFCVSTDPATNPCPKPMTPTTTFTDATITVFQGGNIVLKQSFTP